MRTKFCLVVVEDRVIVIAVVRAVIHVRDAVLSPDQDPDQLANRHEVARNHQSRRSRSVAVAAKGAPLATASLEVAAANRSATILHQSVKHIFTN